MSHGRATARPIFIRSGLVAVAVAVAVAAVALTSCASVGGTATAPSSVAQSLTTTTSQSSVAASSPSPSASSSSSPTSQSSPTSSAVTSTSRGAIPGVPHSVPLPDTDLIVSRNADDQTDLYIVDTTTGMVGDKITNGSPGGQYPTLSPDRGSIVYLQAGMATPCG